MQPLTNRRLVAGATALLVVLTACGGGDEEAKPDSGGGGDEVATDDETTTTTAATRASCTPEALTEAAVGSYADAAISEQACASGFGIALITAGGIDESAAFFRDEGGTWVFLSIGAVDASTGDSLPEGFPATIFSRWLSRRAAATATPTTQAPVEDNSDFSEYDDIPTNEVTTTTAPPTTTTTSTTAPPTTERQLDPYCIEFPEEASCLEDPYLN